MTRAGVTERGNGAPAATSAPSPSPPSPLLPPPHQIGHEHSFPRRPVSANGALALVRLTGAARVGQVNAVVCGWVRGGRCEGGRGRVRSSKGGGRRRREDEEGLSLPPFSLRSSLHAAAGARQSRRPPCPASDPPAYPASSAAVGHRGLIGREGGRVVGGERERSERRRVWGEEGRVPHPPQFPPS